MTGYHSVIIGTVEALSPQGQFSLFEGGVQGSFSILLPQRTRLGGDSTEPNPRNRPELLAEECMHCASGQQGARGGGVGGREE